MKKSILTIFIFATAISSVFAKGKWIMNGFASIGFHQKPIYLWSYPVKESSSLVFGIGMAYEQFLLPKWSLSMGLEYFQILNKIEVNQEAIEGTTYQLKVPLKTHFYYKDVSFFAGFGLQNYRAPEDMALNKSFNFRWQADLGIAWYFHPSWAVYASYSRLLTKEIDSFLTSSFSDLISLGIQLNLSNLLSKDHD